MFIDDFLMVIVVIVAMLAAECRVTDVALHQKKQPRYGWRWTPP